ncbi:MAG: hypothetical protein MJ189_02505 [Coriobacteriales bacterium]|nr:hypothetical protein [Coriobacteriales bacterium]
MAFIEKNDINCFDATKELIDNKIASKISSGDASCFSFDKEIEESVATRLGWVRLASNPPLGPAKIAVIAQQARCEGLDAVVLIGQGGSTQASQTITKLRSLEIKAEIPFKTMDSLSPVYVNHILGSSDPARTLYIVSSKSGSTLEPTVLSHVAWSYACAHLGEEAAGKRFVAITDKGSQLEEVARKNNWRCILNGEEAVGGRYSALSVFGLLPMASVGIDIEAVLEDAIAVENACAQDSADNPALQLASFLYTCYKQGRDKFSLIMPPKNQVFGLWVEQLVAESLGKHGVGILPNVEIDAGILSDPHKDRCVILCNMNNNSAFEHAKACIHPDIPIYRLDIEDASKMIESFLIWEYAVAFCGWLMKINPFDQPNVESTKIQARKLLGIQNGAGAQEAVKSLKDSYRSFDLDDCDYADKIYLSQALFEDFDALDDDFEIGKVLRVVFSSIENGDYFSLNAFLPFRGVGRRETLERIRHRVADRLSACSCLEIGPRYLHSTGQLHKGGKNNGVFLIVSADETYDISVPHTDYTLGDVEKAEALGDFIALSSNGRRCVYVNLKDNDSQFLANLADDVCAAISSAYTKRVK